MSTVDYLQRGIEVSAKLILPLLDDMRDNPMQVPTHRGGNPPIWILGHLTYAESNIVEHIMRGGENPLLEWKTVFGARQEPSSDAADYPAWDEIRAKFDEVRKSTLGFVAETKDYDLTTAAKNCPEGREAMFGTIGDCLMTIGIHTMMHYGQVADARRAAGRSPLIA